MEHRVCVYRTACRFFSVELYFIIAPTLICSNIKWTANNVTLKENCSKLFQNTKQAFTIFLPTLKRKASPVRLSLWQIVELRCIVLSLQHPVYCQFPHVFNLTSPLTFWLICDFTTFPMIEIKWLTEALRNKVIRPSLLLLGWCVPASSLLCKKGNAHKNN